MVDGGSGGGGGGRGCVVTLVEQGIMRVTSPVELEKAGCDVRGLLVHVSE